MHDAGEAGAAVLLVSHVFPRCTTAYSSLLRTVSELFSSALQFRRSNGEVKQRLKEPFEFSVVGGLRQSGQEFPFQHFPGNRAATVGVRGAAVWIVPKTR
jgi:hypothetical protein